ACVIVTLVLAGKLIERNAKRRASRWITLLHRMMPNKARLFVAGQEHFVSIEALEPGQVVVVKAGERIPVDGTVVDGESHADESLLTGESKAVAKKAGDATAAGSVNLDGVLHVRVLRTANESRLAGIVAMVEHALSTHSPIERIVDRVSRIFVPCVVLIALLTFASMWLWGGLSVGSSLMRAISVLVIACPCALGMATPLAITAAMGSASRQGILFRDGGVLEALRKVDAVVLDKTGTITEGNFSVLDFEVVMQEEPETMMTPSAMATFDAGANRKIARPRKLAEVRAEILSLAASVEHYSEHPLGKALVAFASAQGARLEPATSLEVVKGKGIVGYVGGRRVVIGNRKLLADQEAVFDPHFDRLFEEQAQHWE